MRCVAQSSTPDKAMGSKSMAIAQSATPKVSPCSDCPSLGESPKLSQMDNSTKYSGLSGHALNSTPKMRLPMMYCSVCSAMNSHSQHQRPFPVHLHNKPLPELLFPANRFAEIGYQTLFDDKPTWYVYPLKAEEVCGSENADPWDPSKAFMVTYNDPQYLYYVTRLSNGYVVGIQMQDTDTLDYARGFFNLYVGSFKNDRTSEYQYQLDSEQNIQGCRIMRYNRFSDVLMYDSRGLLITCGTLTTIYQITPYGNSEQSVEQLMSLFLQHALNHFTEPQYVY